MTLQATIHAVSKLRDEDRWSMWQLMDAHYENVTTGSFFRDLEAKRWAILLRDREGGLQGFSTLTLVQWNDAFYLFSGDTIVAPEHWLDGGLVGAFGHILLRLFQEYGEENLFWFLISKGFRTYRLLPLHFKVYVPSLGMNRPDLLARRNAVARQILGPAYDAHRGVLRAHVGKDRLRPEWASIPEHRKEDPHVRFFLEANPAFAQGEELACLTPLSRSNLTSMAWRSIRHTEVQWDVEIGEDELHGASGKTRVDPNEE